MTRRTNATVAGVAFLVYIAAGLGALFLSNRATGGESGAAAKLASIAAHAPEMRLAVVLELVGCFCALVLAVTLYAITRDEDPDLALLVLVFRTAEGVNGAVSLPRGLGKVWLATVSGSDAPDPAATHALAAVLFQLPTGGATIGGTFFAVGSTIFSYLLLRGRMVPPALAWLGLAGSLLVAVSLPLQMAGVLEGVFTQVMWLPLLVFELTVAVWLIVKGAALPARRPA